MSVEVPLSRISYMAENTVGVCILDTYKCPFIGKTICVGYCYDVQMVRLGAIREVVVDSDS